ncbi:MAG TPA: hypothetical protein VF984_13285, partial [Actinomycetota bacterium]
MRSRSTVIAGAGPGAHAALLFGATFPERTRALCLWDLYAWAGAAFRPTDLDLLTRTWGTEAAAAAAMAQVAPSMVGDRDFLRWYAKVQRHFVPPEAAAELMRSALDTDIRPLLRRSTSRRSSSRASGPTTSSIARWPRRSRALGS